MSFSRNELVLLRISKVFDSLVAKGYITRNPFPLTGIGKKVQEECTQVTPTKEELLQTLRVVGGDYPREEEEAILKLMSEELK